MVSKIFWSASISRMLTASRFLRGMNFPIVFKTRPTTRGGVRFSKARLGGHRQHRRNCFIAPRTFANITARFQLGEQKFWFLPTRESKFNFLAFQREHDGAALRHPPTQLLLPALRPGHRPFQDRTQEKHFNPRPPSEVLSPRLPGRTGPCPSRPSWWWLAIRL